MSQNSTRRVTRNQQKLANVNATIGANPTVQPSASASIASDKPPSARLRVSQQSSAKKQDNKGGLSLRKLSTSQEQSKARAQKDSADLQDNTVSLQKVTSALVDLLENSQSNHVGVEQSPDGQTHRELESPFTSNATPI